ncbi:ribosome silencing factor [Undibacterium jejuense]|uniref:Ribosomal silencing factor RsfS n=1 Tax=Undibacterium jejuense TaxID=1344949 RepID=A0A923HS60_9BURK|nr:ribosome silencing factor [Undibacterium jejuense]MBC3863738.1 ribosome silencing factor [Undibacterium jejuense]
MDIKKLQTLVVDALEDVKGQDIQLFDTTHLTSLFDRVLVASGTSNRQTKALAASVRDKVKEAGGNIVSVEGETTGEWVLVDLGDMVVHIMQPAIRAYYRLEELWGDKPVKLGAEKRTSKRTAAEPAETEKPKRAPRKATGKAAPLEVTHDMMAIQTTLDDEKKPARKPRASKAVDGDAKPARKPATRKAADGSAAKPAKIPTGGRVKVAATKTATASAKQAAAKRPARKKVAE